MNPLTPERIAEIEKRITQYLEAGGLFNPELMEHDKVRDLLMDCRSDLLSEIKRLREEFRIERIDARKNFTDFEGAAVEVTKLRAQLSDAQAENVKVGRMCEDLLHERGQLKIWLLERDKQLSDAQAALKVKDEALNQAVTALQLIENPYMVCETFQQDSAHRKIVVQEAIASATAALQPRRE